jgi:hypothetical protein
VHNFIYYSPFIYLNELTIKSGHKLKKMIAKKIKQTNIIKYNDNCIIIKIYMMTIQKITKPFVLKNLR